MSRNNKLITAQYIVDNFNIIDIINKYTELSKKGHYYMGLCPFHNEKEPSFSVKNNRFKCYAWQKEGNGVINFIMLKENLTFKQALEWFNHQTFNTSKTNNKIKKITKPLRIEFTDGNFTAKHEEYWKNFDMDQKWLESKNVFAVKEWAMGYDYLKKIPFTKDEIAFAYYAEDIKKCKILRIGPEIKPKDKWRNNVPNDYLWYYNDYKENVCDIGFIVKSVKDCLILQKTGRCAVATNNESDTTFLNNNVEKINKIFKKTVVCYGTDPDGKRKSINITKKTGYGWFNMENHLYDDFKIEDFADYLNAGFSYKQLITLLNIKGF
jgi:DNA primase (bacterial type)